MDLIEQMDVAERALSGIGKGHIPYDRGKQRSLRRPASAETSAPPSDWGPLEDKFQDIPSYDGADTVREHALHRGEAVRTAPPAQRHATEASSPGSREKDSNPYTSDTTLEAFLNRMNSLISPDVSSVLLHRYISLFAPHIPMVVFPPGILVDDLMHDKPVLCLCILSVASRGVLQPRISEQLTREALNTLATCVVRDGAASLELVQALQVMTLWYKPGEKERHVNFYTFLHMAAIMAIDIGLGKPPKGMRTSRTNLHWTSAPESSPNHASDSLEAMRAYLGCYHLCVGASMILRRPNMIRWSSYLSACTKALESHPDALPSDRRFCAYVKLQRICEEIGIEFLMEEDTAAVVHKITDPEVQHALGGFKAQLQDWKDSISPADQTPDLIFFEHVASLYLHEIVVHFNHNVNDFRLPLTEESLGTVPVYTSDTVFSRNQIAAFEAALNAAHGVLDTMLQFDVSTVRTLPTLIYVVRCKYALIILLKMHIAIRNPNSGLAKILKPEDVRVGHYIDGVMALFQKASEEGEDGLYSRALLILDVMRNWLFKQDKAVPTQHRGQEQSAEMETWQQEGSRYNGTHPRVFDPTSGQIMGRPDPNESQPSQHLDQRLPGTEDIVTHLGGSLAGYNVPVNLSQQPTDTVAFDTFAVPGLYQVSGDPAAFSYDWGTGFEQAMDITVGDLGGTQHPGMHGHLYNGAFPGHWPSRQG